MSETSYAHTTLYWYDPANPEITQFFSGRTAPIAPGHAIPGKEGRDWGSFHRGGHPDYWKCAYCGGSRPSTQHRCSGCGAPQP